MKPEAPGRPGVDVMESLPGDTFYEISPTRIYLKASQLSVASQRFLLWPLLHNEKKYDSHSSVVSVIISTDLRLNPMT